MKRFGHRCEHVLRFTAVFLIVSTVTASTVSDGHDWALSTSQAARFIKPERYDAVDTQFGLSVASDGVLIVVGEPYEDGCSNGINAPYISGCAESGKVTVYTRDCLGCGTLSVIATLKASNANAGDRFGRSVSVSGHTIVVGAPLERGSSATINGNEALNDNLEAGAVYIFELVNSTVMVQTDYVKPSNARSQVQFGNSVGIRHNALVVGAYGDWECEGNIDPVASNYACPGAGAAYVFHRDADTGAWSQRHFIKSPVPHSNVYFGWSVAISDDIMVIGAFQENSCATTINGDQTNQGCTQAGNAIAYLRFNDAWIANAALFASDGAAGAFLGNSVACDSLTRTAVVTAYYADKSYVFVESEGVWTQQAILQPANVDSGDAFGVSCDIHGDVIAVGAYSEASIATGVGGNELDNSQASTGAVYVFVRAAGPTWIESAYVKPTNSKIGRALAYGEKVTLTSDSLVVASSRDESCDTGIDANDTWSGCASGAIWLYVVPPVSATHAARDWSRIAATAYVKSDRAAVGWFGSDVSVSHGRLAVGASRHDGCEQGINAAYVGGCAQSGAVYMYRWDDIGEFWAHTHTIKSTLNGAGDTFGNAVALQRDRLVVGAHSVGGSGRVFYFTRDAQDDTWTEIQVVIGQNTGNGDFFGVSVALDGVTLLVGAFGEATCADGIDPTPDDGCTNAGAAYIFDLQAGSGLWQQRHMLKASASFAGDNFGYSVALSGGIAIVGAYAEDSCATTINGDQNSDLCDKQGAAYAFLRGGGGVWVQSAYLKSSDGKADDEFGINVAVSGTTAIVGARQYSGGSGRTYVFEFNVDTVTWAEEQILFADAQVVASQFGYEVEILHNSVIAIGAYGDSSCAVGIGGDAYGDDCAESGAVHLWTRAPASAARPWMFQSTLKAPNTDGGDWFGHRLALDPRMLVVGAPKEAACGIGAHSAGGGPQADNGCAEAGAVYSWMPPHVPVVAPPNRDWTRLTQTRYVKPPSTSSTYFGGAVAANLDGSVVVATAIYDNNCGVGVDAAIGPGTCTSSGAAFIYEAGIAKPYTHVKASNTAMGHTDRFGAKVAVDSSSLMVAISATYEDSNAVGFDGDDSNTLAADSGAVWLYEGDGDGGWQQVHYLKAINTRANAGFGSAMSMHNGTLAVSAPGESSCADGIDGDDADTLCDAAGAVYLYERAADGTVSFIHYVKATNSETGDYFGYSVALSYNFLAVGAPGEKSCTAGVPSNNACSYAGATYVYERASDGTWSNVAYVKASDPTIGDWFGNAVAIDAESRTLLVGAFFRQSNRGAVYMFREESGWATQQVVLLAPYSEVDNYYGVSVHLLGGVAAIGAHQDDACDADTPWDNECVNSGAVHLYVVDDSTGAFEYASFVKSAYPDAADLLGIGVALCDEALYVGARGEQSCSTGEGGDQTDNACVSGALYEFTPHILPTSSPTASPSPSPTAAPTRSPYTFGIGRHIYTDGNVKELFGRSVAACGTTLLVGASSGAGAAYSFHLEGVSWVQDGELMPNVERDGLKFGHRLALWTGVQRQVAVVGTIYDDNCDVGVNSVAAPVYACAFSGAAYIFGRNTSADPWIQEARLKASNAEAADRFGIRVAVYEDTVVVGAETEGSCASGVNNAQTNGCLNAGAAYVFHRDGDGVWSQEAYLKPSDTQSTPPTVTAFFGSGVAVNGDTVAIGAPQKNHPTFSCGLVGGAGCFPIGQVYIFERTSPATWVFKTILYTDKRSTVNFYFGYHVTFGADGTLLAISGHGDPFCANMATSCASSGSVTLMRKLGGDNTNWAYEAYLKPPVIDNGMQFGLSIGVGANVVVVGARYEDRCSTQGGAPLTCTDSGAAHVFRLDGTWQHADYWKGEPTVRDGEAFGISVSVADNDVVLVGSPCAGACAPGVGYVNSYYVEVPLTSAPTLVPTTVPTQEPTLQPTMKASSAPTLAPTMPPTSAPTSVPTGASAAVTGGTTQLSTTQSGTTQAVPTSFTVGALSSVTTTKDGGVTTTTGTTAATVLSVAVTATTTGGADNSGLATWVAPVAGTLGFIVLVLLVVVCVPTLFARFKQRRRNEDAKDNERGTLMAAPLVGAAGNTYGGGERNYANAVDGGHDASVLESAAPQATGERRKKGGLSPSSSYRRTKARAKKHESIMIASKFLIESNELKRKRKLGEGAFGVVYQGVWKRTAVAIKVVKVESEEGRDEAVGEALAMQALPPHPHVVQLYGVCRQPFSIVQEFCALGSLFSHLYGNRAKEGLVGDDEVPHVVIGVAKGVAHLHRHKIVHGDLAARNVLLMKDKSAKICDFGMSKQHIDEDGVYQSTKSTAVPIKWFAPEQLSSLQFSSASDIWALAVVFYEVYERTEPWHGVLNSMVPVKVMRGDRLEFGSKTPPGVRQLASKCFAHIPSERPSADACVDALYLALEMHTGDSDSDGSLGDVDDKKVNGTQYDELYKPPASHKKKKRKAQPVKDAAGHYDEVVYAPPTNVVDDMTPPLAKVVRSDDGTVLASADVSTLYGMPYPVEKKSVYAQAGSAYYTPGLATGRQFAVGPSQYVAVAKLTSTATAEWTGMRDEERRRDEVDELRVEMQAMAAALAAARAEMRRIADKSADATMELSSAMTELSAHVRTLEEVSATQLRHAEMLDALAGRPSTLMFYRTVHVMLEQVFVSTAAAVGGRVQTATGASATATGISLCGKLVSFLPGIGGMASGAIAAFGKLMSKGAQEERMEAMRRLSMLVGVSEAADLALLTAAAVTTDIGERLDALPPDALQRTTVVAALKKASKRLKRTLRVCAESMTRKAIEEEEAVATETPASVRVGELVVVRIIARLEYLVASGATREQRTTEELARYLAGAAFTAAPQHESAATPLVEWLGGIETELAVVIDEDTVEIVTDFLSCVKE